MALTPYCEREEVRAALGVNSTELPDAVLDLPVYQIGLLRELTKLSLSLPASFLAAEALASSARTAAQAELHDATRLFSVYAAARQVGVSLGGMVPKSVGDGKATVSRFSDAPYKDVLDRVDAMLAAARASLLQTLDGGAPQALVLPAFFAAAQRTYDPVTGA